MVLFREGGGSTPLVPQPNPKYYGTSSTTGTTTGAYTFTPPPNPTPGGGSTSGGNTTTTPPPMPSTGLSKVIASEVAAMNTPPPMHTTPPQVPIIPALGPNFVGWAPWQLIQQWGSSAELREFLDNLLKQAELRQQILEQMAKEGLPTTPAPIITEQETTQPIGLRVRYIPM